MNDTCSDNWTERLDWRNKRCGLNHHERTGQCQDTLVVAEETVHLPQSVLRTNNIANNSYRHSKPDNTLETGCHWLAEVWWKLTQLERVMEWNLYLEFVLWNLWSMTKQLRNAAWDCLYTFLHQVGNHQQLVDTLHLADRCGTRTGHSTDTCRTYCRQISDQTDIRSVCS